MPTLPYDECYGGTYDPDTLDDFLIKRRVAAVAIGGAAGKAAHAKRRDS
jgi:hypothetical protein